MDEPTTQVSVGGTTWRCMGYNTRRLLPHKGLCCLGGAVLLFNLLSLYLLHTSPSRFMHAHGGVVPRRQMSPLGGVVGPGGWDSLGNVRCRPLRFIKVDGVKTGRMKMEEERPATTKSSGSSSSGGGSSREGRWSRRRKGRERMVLPLHPSPPPGAGARARALASAPGSGNTWLRHLLQQATGFLTGSMYNDTFLMTSGFPGEGISNDSVLVVKTHDADPDDQRHFRSAILLVRHPRDAILAEFNRLHGGHLGSATLQDFRKDWKSHVIEAANQWAILNTQWLRFSGPLHIVRYEDLQRDLSATLGSVLRFLNVTVTAQDVECAVQHSGHAYRRRKNKMAEGSLSEKDLFSDELLSVLRQSERRFQIALDIYYLQKKREQLGFSKRMRL